MKLFNKIALPLIYLSFFATLPACQAETTPTRANFCQPNGKEYFSCSIGEQVYTLCDASEGRLAFVKEENRKATLIFAGDARKEYSFSNYHRYKTTQNTVTFISNKKYEIFEYIDEETEPAEKEFGIVISSNSETEALNLYCDPGAKSSIIDIENL